MTEFITRNYGNKEYEVIIKTDNKEHYMASQEFARKLIDHAKPVTDNNVGSKWIPGKQPPKEWKDEKGDAINFIAVIPGIGIDIANWIEPTRCWFCLGVPCKVTHWMPLPEPPKEDSDEVH